MPNFNTITSFNAGELSTRFQGRFDLSKYYSGCETLLNCLIFPMGGSLKRSGTIFMGKTKYRDKKTLLIKFQFSAYIYCMIEMGHKYFRFYTQNGIYKVNGKIYEVEHTYTEEDLDNVHIESSADIIFFTDGKQFPKKLARYANDDWRFSDIDFEIPPFKKPNVTELELTPKEANKKNTTITANEDLFEEKDVTGVWLFTQVREDHILEGEFTEDKTTDWIKCKGTFNLTTDGVWIGEVAIERTFDNGKNVYTVRKFKSDESFNVNFNGNEDVENVLYRLKYTDKKKKGDESECSYTFTVDDCFLDCPFKITKFIDTKNVEVEFTSKTPSGTKPTVMWREAAWSPKNGYPKCALIYEERLWFGGTFLNPVTLWGSEIRNWYLFYTGKDRDSDPVEINISSSDELQWMLAFQKMAIGTTNAEWTLGSEESDKVISPTNLPQAIKESQTGSCRLQPIFIRDSVVYVQGFGKLVSEFAYNWQEQKYRSPELTLLASHITGSGLIDLTYALHPQPIVWGCIVEGEIIGLTFNREQEVIAWHRHKIAEGKVKSVATMPHNECSEECLWMIAERDINGKKEQHIEYTAPQTYTDLKDFVGLDSCIIFNGGDTFNISNISYTDDEIIVETDGEHTFQDGFDIKLHNCGKLSNFVCKNITVINEHTFKTQWHIEDYKYEGGGTCDHVENTFDIPHLEGKKVVAFMDGEEYPEVEVKDGKAAFSDYGNKVIIGMLYEANTTPMPFVLKGDGNSRPLNSIITDIIIRFEKTYNAYLEIDGEKIDINWNSFYEKLKDTPYPESGDYEVACNPTASRTKTISIIQKSAFPMCILNIFSKMEFSDT